MCFLRVFLLANLMLPATVFAASIWCIGTPKEISIWGNGSNWLAVDFEEYEGPWILCDLDSDVSGVSASSCKAMYSAALVALSATSELKLNFDSTEYATCNDIPSWTTSLPNSFNIFSIVK